MGADGSLLTVTTVLGADALDPTRLHAEEAISAPFVFTVEMTSSRQAIDPDSMLYQPACVALASSPDSTRYFHGRARSFRGAGMTGRGEWLYSVELVPDLWFMSQTRDCRVFENQSAVAIIKTILQDNNVTAVSWRVQGDQTTRDHTVQYNETDLEFATRLMEEEGYFYFFEHSASAHTLVVADTNGAFSKRLGFDLRVVAGGGNVDTLPSWRRAAATVTGSTRMQDYDPLKPSDPVDGTQATVLKAQGASRRDAYHWPALTDKAALAASRARFRQEAAEAASTLYEASGTCGDLVPGLKFTVGDDSAAGAVNREFVVRAVVHEASEAQRVAGSRVWTYANSFTAFPSATTWRAPPTVPRPSMAGIFSAIVVGTSGDAEIHTDQYGRVKVRLMWDHRQDSTGDSTVWVRVMQPWSGNTWGWQHLPRVGTEVGVAFVDGDPDHPIVVGCLYNAEQMPVFPLPDQKTKSGLRTRSTLNGGTSDFSEWSFDDKTGSELVYLHAQKDHTVEVENDQKVTVDNDRFLTVKANETIEITKAQSVKIGQGRTTEVTAKNESLTVKQGDIAVEASAGAIAHTAMKSYTVESKTDGISNKAMLDIKVNSLTGSVLVSALTSIELKVGASLVKVDQSGVSIKGMMIKLDGTMMLDLNGLMTKVSGEAMTMVKGGIMMLN